MLHHAVGLSQQQAQIRISLLTHGDAKETRDLAYVHHQRASLMSCHAVSDKHHSDATPQAKELDAVPRTQTGGETTDAAPASELQLRLRHLSTRSCLQCPRRKQRVAQSQRLEYWLLQGSLGHWGV